MYRQIRPAKAVDAERGGRWFPGALDAWRKHDGRWQGYVFYTVGVGMRHVEWAHAERLRPSTRHGLAKSQRIMTRCPLRDVSALISRGAMFT
jgi:hypothetical protein